MSSIARSVESLREFVVGRISIGVSVVIISAAEVFVDEESRVVVLLMTFVDSNKFCSDVQNLIISEQYSNLASLFSDSIEAG